MSEMPELGEATMFTKEQCTERTIGHILAYHRRWSQLRDDYKEQLIEMDRMVSPGKLQLEDMARCAAMIEDYSKKMFAAEQILRPLGHDVGW